MKNKAEHTAALELAIINGSKIACSGLHESRLGYTAPSRLPESEDREAEQRAAQVVRLSHSSEHAPALQESRQSVDAWADIWLY